MRPWLDREFGNASSLHSEGRAARRAIDEAREIVSEALGSDFAEIIFTSSGTEAANLAIVGAAIANTDPKRNRVLFSAVEHHCVLETRPLLEKLGYRVGTIPVDREARTSLEDFEQLIGEDVLLVSVMHANNEIGTIQPIHEVAEIAHRVGALYHCDAVQTFCEIPFRLADLISVSAHKIYGPKGAGALYVKAGTKIKPLTVGGGQERELRAGTENVAAIIGFGAAVKWLRANPHVFNAKERARDAFVETLRKSENPRLRFSVEDTAKTISGHAHLRVEGLSAESMLIVLDRMGVSASSGAACSSGSIEPSHVLLACGYSQEQAREGLRFTFGIHSTEEEAMEAAHRVEEAAKQVALGKSDRVPANR
jgi:cysteine desulfurase